MSGGCFVYLSLFLPRMSRLLLILPHHKFLKLGCRVHPWHEESEAHPARGNLSSKIVRREAWSAHAVALQGHYYTVREPTLFGGFLFGVLGPEAKGLLLALLWQNMQMISSSSGAHISQVPLQEGVSKWLNSIQWNMGE